VRIILITFFLRKENKQAIFRKKISSNVFQSNDYCRTCFAL